MNEYNSPNGTTPQTDNKNMIQCKTCAFQYPKNFKKCPQCGNKKAKPFYLRWWFWLIAIIVILGVASSTGVKKNQENTEKSYTETDTETRENTPTPAVTYANFEKIENGMTYEQVVEIFGEDGKILSESTVLDTSMQIYYWYDSTGISNCNVTFQNNKVMAKAQIGLK